VENVFPITPGEIPSFEYTDFSTAIRTASFGSDPYPEPQCIDYNIFDNQLAFDRFYTLRDGANLRWILLSVGPDRRSDYDQINPKPIQATNALSLGANSAYDPTNGTVSLGDIVRTQFSQRN
jgi:hypothetical protein